ncbi:aminopeptidase [Syntrophotalea acetylenivorans]|uniref:aminopeptidase n=1 Tax=Syntrophotalea acetylenivorans TaxID=1842532 RepID=UPI0009FAD24B|nr:aminopeptidase [Syntrophotalea acetylenivorans]
MLITGLVIMAGCSRLGYYAHCTQGHLALLAGRTPIAKLLSDPATPEELVTQLQEISRIRDFASTELKLPVNGSYRSYSDLNRPFATWNVVAAKEFDLQPLHWCFPVAGCLPYQGFFDRQRAETFAAELKKQGYDTYLYGVAAYSTLGWFDDPVLRTFLNGSPVDWAGIIFHELAHQQLFLPNDPEFSEGFATAVEQLGVNQWLDHNASPGAIAAYHQRIQGEVDFIQLLVNLRQQLADLYRQPLCPDCMRQGKAELLASFIADYDQWKREAGGDGGYDEWVSDQLNNAKLASVNTYHQTVASFLALFVQQGNNFAQFYQAAREISKLPENERIARLQFLEQTAHNPLP